MSTLKTQFDRLVNNYEQLFLTAPVIEAARWQSTNAPAPMVELFNQSFTLNLEGVDDLDVYREVIRPNLPWADRHFEEERVSREPINPGETWKIWPYAQSAATHLREGENVAQYDHSYAERYWPKFAGLTPDGRIFKAGTRGEDQLNQIDLRFMGPETSCRPKDLPGNRASGIRFPYGDLDDVIKILMDDPLTRQAYLPIFFPEDITASLQSKRIPCTLGYHFICRMNQLHIYYPMRSCDFVRHWRDDVYLTLRLLLWVLNELKWRDPETWADIQPGTFRMHMTSLHMFTLDRENLRHRLRNR